jgi:hypothetical protein
VRQEEELTTFSELRASKGSGRKVDYEVSLSRPFLNARLTPLRYRNESKPRGS